jgi:hypothetical protein
MGFNTDILSATTISGGTFYGDGSGLVDNTITEIINSPTQNPLNVNTSNDYLPITGNDQYQDEASNYISWTNGSNNGTGFNPWTITTQPNTGVFLGNPASDGMGTAGIGTNAFALFATDGSNYVSTSRTFTSGMNVGDVFSFYWAINFDANGGNKGFDLKAGGTTIFNANNNNSATITSNLSSPNNIIDSGYGTTPMLVTLTRTSDILYNITITSRSGGPTYSASINSPLVVNEINFYCGAQGDGLGQRNLFFNQLLITKTTELLKITVDDLGSLFGGGSLYEVGSGADSTQRCGVNNVASGNCSIVAGGYCNTSSSQYSTISGGRFNTSSGQDSTVSGGRNNTSSGDYSTVSGGYGNKSSGDFSTVSGGRNNASGINGTVSGLYNQTYLGSTLNGTFNSISPSSTSSGYGNGATFNFVFNTGSLSTVTLVTIGSEYVNGDQLLFDGTLFGGSSGTDDVTLNINTQNIGNGSTVGGGRQNTSSGGYSTVSGGYNNTSSGGYSTISGGRRNIASCYYSTIGGGYLNTSSSDGSTVSGGQFNTSSADYSTIGGGRNNVSGINGTVSSFSSQTYLGSTLNGTFNSISPSSTSSGYGNGATFNFVFNTGILTTVNLVTIGSGYVNGDLLTFDGTLFGGSSGTDDVTLNINTQNIGNSSTVSGGRQNTSSGCYSTISGGYLNTANCIYSFIGGGNGNTIIREVSTISGGQNNTSLCAYTFIGGGAGNKTYKNYSVVGGGTNNTANGDGSFIGGGLQNTANCAFSTVSGGRCNTSNDTNSTVSGGQCNTASCYYSTISGGRSNTASNYNSTVSGGYSNTSSGYASFVGGGVNNASSGIYSIVSGGYNNTTINGCSAILGGQCNTTQHDCSFIVGSGICSTAANTTHVNCLHFSNIPTSSAGLAPGTVWNNGGVLNIA